MNRSILFSAAAILIGWSAVASGDPYTIENEQIVRVDLSHQTMTAIGNGPHRLSAIEFSQDGYLYGVDPNLDTLERIDPATGDSETVGSLGILPGSWFVDLDEDAGGQLWLLASDSDSSRLYTVDRTTGATSLYCQSDVPNLMGLASLGGHMWTTTTLPNPPDPGCGLEYLPSSLGAYRTHLETGSDGWIYGLSGVGHPSLELTSYFFFRVHPVTGTEGVIWYLITNISHVIEGFTFDPTEQLTALPVPTLDRRSAAVLILLLVAAGAWILHHKP